MKTPVEIVADALRPLPPLWLHQASENEWHVCHWKDDIEGGKMKCIVVAEASNEDEAIQKRDRIRDQRAGATAIAALEAAGYVILRPEIDEKWLKCLAQIRDLLASSDNSLNKISALLQYSGN